MLTFSYTINLIKYLFQVCYKNRVIENRGGKYGSELIRYCCSCGVGRMSE